MEKPKYELESEIKNKKYIISGDVFLTLNELLFNKENLNDINLLLFFLGQLKGLIIKDGIKEYSENINIDELLEKII